MPITTSWIIETRLALIIYRQSVTLEDIQSLDNLALMTLDQADQPIHTIHDLREVELLPSNWTRITTATRSIHHPLCGEIVLVFSPTSLFVEIAARFFTHAFGIAYQRAETIEEAQALLTAHYPDLET